MIAYKHRETATQMLRPVPALYGLLSCQYALQKEASMHVGYISVHVISENQFLTSRLELPRSVQITFWSEKREFPLHVVVCMTVINQLSRSVANKFRHERVA